MHTLIIKGDMAAAFKAADAHQVELHSIATHGRFDECIASTPDRFLPLLQRWYNADCGRAPFPAGTLLFFSYSGE